MILACRRSYRLEHELAEVIGTIYNARSLRRILIEPCCGSIQGSASYQQDEWLPGQSITHTHHMRALALAASLPPLVPLRVVPTRLTCWPPAHVHHLSTASHATRVAGLLQDVPPGAYSAICAHAAAQRHQALHQANVFGGEQLQLLLLTYPIAADQHAKQMETSAATAK
eukprot:1142242-Pelagomonas_calceolata.AAC.4